MAVITLSATPPAAAASEEAAERININTAPASELAELPGIGPVRAAQIVRIRERNGPFRCVEELRAVPRLPEKDFQKLRKLVTVGSARSDHCEGDAVAAASSTREP